MLQQIDTVSEVLARHAAGRGAQPALVSARGVWTYEALERDVHAFACRLRDVGIGPGSTVGLLCTNRAEWVIAALGTIVAGAQAATFNTWSRRWDLDHLLRASRCEALVAVTGFGDTDLLPLLQELVPEAWRSDRPGWRSAAYPQLHELVLVGDGAFPGGARTFRELLLAGRRAPAASGREDTALVLYTSGSTAEPKAVPLVQGTLLEHGFDVGVRMGVNGDDRIWLAVPLFWSYGGANALMVSLTHGATLVLQEFFDAGEALRLIEQQRCSVAYTLPNITAALLAHPDFSPQRVRSLRKGMTIGSKADVLAAATGLGIAGICNAYGSTEIYGCCTATPHDWPLERKAECQGPPLPRIRVVIRDRATGAPVPPGTVGEICVSGQVIRGYLDQPQANESGFTTDGDFLTGDLGQVDEEGNVRFAARASEMIKSGGINIAPAEVEQFLRTHPGVVQVAVTGVEDAAKGEVSVAFVIPAAGSGLREDALKAYCREHIASFKVPARIVVTEGPLPTTATGKLARRKLRELAREHWPSPA